MTQPFNPNMLDVGDVLLYKGTGLYGRIIAIKTWHNIGHVEVYAGDGLCWASRDGVGVGKYPLRTRDLAHVLRPSVLFYRDKAEAAFATIDGQPYGWLDLLQFVGAKVNGKGIVCSPAAAVVVRGGGVPVFNGEPVEKIAPFQFLLSELLREIWRAK